LAQHDLLYGDERRSTVTTEPGTRDRPTVTALRYVEPEVGLRPGDDPVLGSAEHADDVRLEVADRGEHLAALTVERAGPGCMAVDADGPSRPVLALMDDDGPLGVLDVFFGGVLSHRVLGLIHFAEQLKCPS
jgi:hypothetical protein